MSEAARTRTHAPEIRQRAVEILQEGSVIALSPQSLASPRPQLDSGPAHMPWVAPTPFLMRALITTRIRLTLSLPWLKIAWKMA